MNNQDNTLNRQTRSSKIRSRIRRITALAALPILLAGLATVIQEGSASATTAHYAQTCYSTTGFYACLSSNEYANGSNSWSTSRNYWCSDNIAIYGVASNCWNHTEGSYRNGAYWEDWANTSWSLNGTALGPFGYKTCVYLRLDIAPNGAYSQRAWSSGKFAWQSC